MSGGYKYSELFFDPSVAAYDATLGCIVLGSVLAQRTAEAAVEAVRRLEAEESALAAYLNSVKAGCTPAAESVRNHLNKHKEKLLQTDHSVLCRRIAQVETTVGAARTHIALQEAMLELSRIEGDIERAVRRKEDEDLRTGQTPVLAALRSRYEGLKQAAGGLLDGPGVDPLGPAGAAASAVKTALAAAGGSLQTNNQNMVAAHVDRLEQAVNTYQDLLRESAEVRARQEAACRQAAVEAAALIAGLRADPVVMRWHAQSVADLESNLVDFVPGDAIAAAAAQSGVAEAREIAAQIVKEAGGAQIKADQRDYVARSISSTLAEMGFVVAEPVEEHPGHPATASIVHAASATGKAIAVSVPVEGQVWYNVEGYVKSTEAAVGGGTAAVCDEAQEVIEQMHDALAEEFHVQMGELMWEGKDPKRMLRAAKSLPQDGASSKGRS